MHVLFEPGFFSNPQVQHALLIGGVVAAVSAMVGVFAVIRGDSFAGHAFTEASATGGSGATLVGVNPILGFVLGAVAAAGALETIGAHRARHRDLATGVVLGASIGAASLFLYLDTSRTGAAGAPQQILFGSIFTTTTSTVRIVMVIGACCVGLLALVHRPLLLSTVDPDIAAARGVPVRAVGLAFLVALALAVGLSSIATGAILSTALLIGPAALALRFTKRMWTAITVALGTGVAATWIGVLLAYDSADWMAGNGLPVSFLIVATIFVAYLAAVLAGHRFNRSSTAAHGQER